MHSSLGLKLLTSFSRRSRSSVGKTSITQLAVFPSGQDQAMSSKPKELGLASGCWGAICLEEGGWQDSTTSGHRTGATGWYSAVR